MNSSLQSCQKLLSVCMIVKNESFILKQCLESLKKCADEIVVVDTGSQDNTVNIAKEFGAKTILSDWRDDFSYSRNISLKNATGRWILWIDADDIIPEDSAKKINELKKTTPDKVYAFIVKNENPGNTGSEFYQARMFPNRPDIYFERRIHEQMMLSALRAGLKLTNTNVTIEHLGYSDPQKVKEKAKRNIKILIEEIKNFPHDATMSIEIADNYLLLDEVDNALEWYKKTLNIPNCENNFPEIASQAYLGLGNICNKREKYLDAINYCQKSVRLCPNRADALYSLAVAMDLSGDLFSARKTLEYILTTEPRIYSVGVNYREAKIKSYLRLERILYDLNKTEEAYNLCNKALADFPNRPEILDMAGRVYYRNNKLIDALHFFENSLKINYKDNIEAFIGLCYIYVAAGRKETALKTLEDIKEDFKHKPIYWSFYSMLTSNKIIIPEEINSKEIERENNTILKLYGKLGDKK